MIPSGAQILVVEDDKATRRMICQTLARDGFQVLEEATGEAALEAFLRSRPALVVLDIMLPGIDGFEVCQRLRASGEEVPILMLTARSEDADKIQGLELGAADYMVKPFNPMELRARLRAILRRMGGRGEGQGDLEYRDVKLQFRQQKCFKGGREVDLTPREFRLLAELLKAPGKVQSREDLSSHIWGKGHFGSPKSLDVYIGRLRRKVEDDPSAPTLIRTARGCGYVCE